jgi:YesN/AraC family two-component response regulator
MQHSTYAEAHLFAAHALSGMTDKAGDPLIAHAERMADTFTQHHTFGAPHRVVAILHDVLEDSDASLYIDDRHSGTLSLGSLSLRLTTEEAYALKAITRLSSETYAEYITRLQTTPFYAASAVKIADLQDHLDRADKIPDSLVGRYRKALAALAK